MLNMLLSTSVSNNSTLQNVCVVIVFLLLAFLIVMMIGLSWYDAYLQKMKKEILNNPQSVEKTYKKENADKDKVRFYVKFKKEHEFHSRGWMDVSAIRYDVEEILRKVKTPWEIGTASSMLPN